VEEFTCAQGKSQAFLWDTLSPSLMVRATPKGRKTYAFEGRLNRQTVRIGIGTVADWPLDKARQRAAELKVMVDNGQDPREVEKQKQAEHNARRQLEQARSLTVAEAWGAYLEERRPRWGEAHYRSHLEKASPGGQQNKARGMAGKLTTPGPLASLMPLRLGDLNSQMIEAWAALEGKKRQSSARLAWRQLSAFLDWCAEQPQFSSLVQGTNPAKSRKARESLGKTGVKDDALLKEQLAAWFSAVRNIQNPVISAALQVMLMTGARPGEVLSLRWEDVNTQWKGLTIRDKVEGTREIPLTPFVESLLSTLPRRNQWVFSSTRTLAMDDANVRRRELKSSRRGTFPPQGDVLATSESGRISKPNLQHTRACVVAGIDLTLHGLRRSFSSLTEWLEIPAGVVAQIQGHKPSATAEKHYKRRPLDLLRMHHERIEAWILEQAGVPVPAPQATKTLKVVANR
jgi:integrase